MTVWGLWTLVLISGVSALLGGVAGFTWAQARERERLAKKQRIDAYARFLAAHGGLGTAERGTEEWRNALEEAKSAELNLSQVGEREVVDSLLQKFGSVSENEGQVK